MVVDYLSATEYEMNNKHEVESVEESRSRRHEDTLEGGARASIISMVVLMENVESQLHMQKEQLAQFALAKKEKEAQKAAYYSFLSHLQFDDFRKKFPERFRAWKESGAVVQCYSIHRLGVPF